jgi:CRP-like cAMP-binding protein
MSRPDATQASGRSTSPLDDIIGALELFAPLGDDARSAIRMLPHEVKDVSKRAPLVRSGRVERDCQLLVSAFAHKLKFTADARRVVAINLPGEIINIESVIGLESDYRAEIFRGGAVASIPAEAVRDLVFSHASIGRALWLRSQAEAAVTREWLLNDQRRSLKSRIAHLISETSLRLHRLRADETAGHGLPLDVDELAQAIGSVPLYVERELVALEEAGVLTNGPEGITIRDAKRLGEIGDFDRAYLNQAYGQPVASAA